jgi:hypothetical protein
VLQTFLIECYWAAEAEGAVRDRASQVADITRDLRDDGRVVALLGTLLIPADEVCFWRFASGSLAEVEETGRRAGLAFDRVMQSIDIAAEHAFDDDPPTTNAGGQR